MKKDAATNQKRPLPARVWLVPLGLLGLCALLALALITLQKPEADAPIDDAPAAESLLLFKCAWEDVDAITVNPPSDVGYTLIYRDGQLYHKTDAPYAVRELISSNVLGALCTVLMEEKVLDTRETVCDLNGFGLENAVCSAEITLQNGEHHVLRLGDQVPYGIPYRYCMWDSDPAVYLISADVFDALSYSAESLHPVTQPVWDYTFWDQVVIHGQAARTLEKTPAGWQLTAPIQYPVSTENAESFLSSVESIGFATHVASADQADLSTYGLDAPRLTLIMKQAATKAIYRDDQGNVTDEILLPEEDITVYFGSDKDDYYVYCMYLGTVYTATKFQTAFLWNEDLRDLVDPTPLDVPVTEISTLTAATADETHVYTLSLTEQLEENGELKTDEQGHVLYDVHVKKDGEAMDADQFLNWYTAVHTLAPNQTVPDNAALSTDPVLTLTWTGHGFTRDAAFLPLDSLHTALSLNGTAFTYLANTELTPILALP